MVEAAAEPNYSQRQAIVDSLSRKLAASLPDGLTALAAYDSHPSTELQRDLLAMVWRIALASGDAMQRQQLVYRLIEAVMRGSPANKSQALGFLQDFRRADFDARSITVLEHLPWDDDHGSGIIRLVGIAGMRSKLGALRDVERAGAGALSGPSLYASRPWAAALASSRLGDAESLARVVRQVGGEPDLVLRATRLFADLAYTRQGLAFDTLRAYLRSPNRLPQIKANVPGRPEAIYAALMIAKYAEGCPIQSPDMQEGDIAVILAWAESQADWKLRDQQAALR